MPVSAISISGGTKLSKQNRVSHIGASLAFVAALCSPYIAKSEDYKDLSKFTKWTYVRNHSELPDDLKARLDKYQMLSEINKFRKVDEILNQSITYHADDKGDHWQSPSLTWNKKQGDCEDLSILAFYMFKYLNVESRIYVVKIPALGRYHVILKLNDGATYDSYVEPFPYEYIYSLNETDWRRET